MSPTAGAPAPREPSLVAELAPAPVALALEAEMTLEELELGDADLAGATARGITLRSVRLRGTRLPGARLERLELTDATLSGCDLANLQAPRSSWRRVQTDFLEAELDAVCFTGCDLSELDLRGARLRRCELRGNQLDGLRGVQALRGAALRWPDIVGGAGLWAQALGIGVLEEG